MRQARKTAQTILYVLSSRLTKYGAKKDRRKFEILIRDQYQLSNRRMSSVTSMGFVKKSSIPAARARSRSSGKALAVQA